MELRTDARKGKNVVLRIEPGQNNPRNSEGAFIGLKDGSIMFVYSRFTGDSASDHAPACLAGRRSGDGGCSWGDEQLILPNEGDINIMDVSLLRTRNGDIGLFYEKKNSLSDTKPRMRISKDETNTWSEPISVIPDKKGYFVLNNDRVIQLQNGRLLLAVSLHQTPVSEWSNTGRLWSYFSDDNGRTWQSGKEVANPDGVVLQEPGLIALKDGRIMMFIRTDRGVQYFSFSKNSGETWSPAKPGNIPSPLSAASIKRIPSTGDLLLIWNNNEGTDTAIAGKRTPFNSAVSKDEGESWQHIRTIEDDPDGWYSYTAIHFTDDAVLLGHSAGRKSNFIVEKSLEMGTGLSVTNITKLNMEWIYGLQS